MVKNLFRYNIECTKCGKSISFEVHNKKDAINDARYIGWKIGKKNICPACQGIEKRNIEDRYKTKCQRCGMEIDLSFQKTTYSALDEKGKPIVVCKDCFNR